jgi:hypothetical protein
MLRWFSMKWRAGVRVSEYTAIFGGPVWTTPPIVVAGGLGRLLKLQLVSKANQVGWPLIHTPFTPGARAQNETG